MKVQTTGTSFITGPQKTVKTLNQTNKELQKIIEHLSTASRINSAADDAAGLGISEELRTRIRGFKAVTSNIEDSISAFSIADGAGNSIMDILQRQRELAIKSQNGTLNNSDRAALDKEYQSLTKAIDQISSSAQFNKQKVSSGDDLASGDAIIQTGSEASDQIKMPSIDLRANTLGTTGTSIATADLAHQAVTKIDSAIKSVNNQRSTLGSAVNRLESSMNNLSVALVNTQAAESVIRDQDMASGLVELTRLQLLEEGSVKSFGRFKSMSQNHVLGLLGSL